MQSLYDVDEASMMLNANRLNMLFLHSLLSTFFDHPSPKWIFSSQFIKSEIMTYSTKSASSSFSAELFFLLLGIICLIFRRLSLKLSINCIFLLSDKANSVLTKLSKFLCLIFRKIDLFILYLCSVSFRKSIQSWVIRHLRVQPFLNLQQLY